MALDGEADPLLAEPSLQCDHNQPVAGTLPSDWPFHHQSQRRVLLPIVTVSLGFLVLFSAYNSLQNFATSLLPGNLGNVSLAILYISVCFFVFTAPRIVGRLGEKTAIMLGAACYVVYMASCIHVIYGVVLAAAVVIGP